MEESKLRGVVRWFRDDLGYGFIDAGAVDVFVHHKDIVMAGHRLLTAGQQVEFEIVDGPKGKQAANVRAI